MVVLFLPPKIPNSFKTKKENTLLSPKKKVPKKNNKRSGLIKKASSFFRKFRKRKKEAKVSKTKVIIGIFEKMDKGKIDFMSVVFFLGVTSK